MTAQSRSIGFSLRAVWGQLDKINPIIWPFVIGGIDPDDLNQLLARVAGFNLGEKLFGAAPVDGRWLDKGYIDGFQVDWRATDINAATACRSRDCRI